jgi:RNA recognition motif-containing protein
VNATQVAVALVPDDGSFNGPSAPVPVSYDDGGCDSDQANTLPTAVSIGSLAVGGRYTVLFFALGPAFGEFATQSLATASLSITVEADSSGGDGAAAVMQIMHAPSTLATSAPTSVQVLHDGVDDTAGDLFGSEQLDAISTVTDGNGGVAAASSRIIVDEACVAGTNDGDIAPAVPTASPAQLCVVTHFLRARVGLALDRLASYRGTGATVGLLTLLEQYHDALVRALETAQSLPDSAGVVHNEGVLSALECDLGEAISRAKEDCADRTHQRSMFLAFSREHLQQRSAGSASSMRSTYSTAEQLSMRLKFLARSPVVSDAVADCGSTSAISNLTAPAPTREALKPTDGAEGASTLTDEEIQLRTERDQDDICFVTLGGWRDVHLGLGLIVRPRTMRERRKGLLPTIELVEDYLSAEAFNEGIRANIGAGRHVLEDRDEVLPGEEHTVVTSSSRARVNAWLPLFINNSNWAVGRALAAPAFSMIATQWNDIFQPEHALYVCIRLLTCTAVRFNVDGRISERAIQMYCDVHRLFLQMASDYPSVREAATDAVRGFIQHPEQRSRRYTKNLGDLLQMVSITGIRWDELEDALVPELARRHAQWVGKLPLKEFGGEEEIVEAWDDAHAGGKVTLFTKAFLDEMMTGVPDEVATNYDRKWSRLSRSQLTRLKAKFAQISRLHSARDKLPMLCTPETAKLFCPTAEQPQPFLELILWAIEHRKDGPLAPRPCSLRAILKRTAMVSGWLASRELLLATRASPPPVLVQLTPTVRLNCRLDSLSSVAEGLKQARALDQPSAVGGEILRQAFVSTRSAHFAGMPERTKAWQARARTGDDDVSAVEMHSTLFVGKLNRQLTSANLATALENLLAQDSRCLQCLQQCHVRRGGGDEVATSSCETFLPPKAGEQTCDVRMTSCSGRLFDDERVPPSFATKATAQVLDTAESEDITAVDPHRFYVMHATVVMNTKTNRSKGYGFVRFRSPEVAAAVLNLAQSHPGLAISDEPLVCDVWRCKLVPNWTPLHLGGGVGVGRSGRSCQSEKFRIKRRIVGAAHFLRMDLSQSVLMVPGFLGIHHQQGLLSAAESSLENGDSTKAGDTVLTFVCTQRTAPPWIHSLPHVRRVLDEQRALGIHDVQKPIAFRVSIVLVAGGTNCVTETASSTTLAQQSPPIWRALEPATALFFVGGQGWVEIQRQRSNVQSVRGKPFSFVISPQDAVVVGTDKLIMQNLWYCLHPWQSSATPTFAVLVTSLFDTYVGD